MLCYPFEERRILGNMRAAYTWSWPVAIQPKLDGERCRFFWDLDASTWTGLSSTEEPIDKSIPHIVSALNRSGIPKSVELDGELYCHGMPFEEIHSICSRRTNLHPDHTAISYHVFDLVSSGRQFERLQLLSLISVHFPPPLINVRTDYCYTLSELYQFLDDNVGRSYEGIIVRDLHAPYDRKRCSWIMKFKPKQEDTYAIVGAKQEEDKNGNPKDSLGAFICEKNGETFSVGSGLTELERKAFWQEYKINPDVFKGLFIRVQYQNITSGKVPRFGVYKAILAEGEE